MNKTDVVVSDSTSFGVRLSFAKWVAVVFFTVAGISGLTLDRWVLNESAKASREKDIQQDAEIKRREAEIEKLETEVRALQDWKIREEARDGKA